MVGSPTKKLIVPTVHPVGPITHYCTARGFSQLYNSAFVGIAAVGLRPLPKSKYIPSPYGFVNPVYSPSSMTYQSYLHWMSKLSRPRGDNITSRDYLRSKEILNVEFSPFVVGGLSALDDVLKDIDWDKSPGWPYVNEGCPTKRDAWIKQSSIIIDRANKLIRGEYVECNFIATLKDELLPPGKNSRVFLPAPFHHQIACALLFKKLTDSLTKTCHSHSSAIGVNIFGRGLERSLRNLSTLPYGYDADQSGCDTSCKDVEPERDFMKNGLPREFHAGVDLLFNTAMCPRVIVADRVLQLQMNPSGWYLTTVINTLRTHRLVASAYLDLSPHVESINDMRQHLKQLNGGDDLAYSTDRPWFGIVQLADYLAQRGVYLESDVLEPRDAMSLTFFSHNLFLRKIDLNQLHIYVAGGRLSKILSAFSFLKIKEGKVNWQRNAARVVGLMTNLWPYKFEFDILFPYLYHMIHHFFLLDGNNLSAEWSGVFRSIPTDETMLLLRSGHARESSSLFSSSHDFSSFYNVKRVFQSALKSGHIISHQLGTNKMSRSTRTVDTMLDKMEKSNMLSEQGRCWLVNALDPFHDSDMRLCGYPDMGSASSVVQLVKRQLQVTVPSNVAAGNNWDASVVLTPLLNTHQTDFEYLLDQWSGSSDGGNTYKGGRLSFGGLCVNTGPQGTELWYDTPNIGFTAANPQVVLPGQFVKGNMRLIGMAFEVVNTTAELYKQGQVTVWRIPSYPTLTNIYDDSTTITRSFLQYRAPPGTVANAQLLYGSRSWAAAEGCYVVGRQNSVSNPPTAVGWQDILISQDIVAGGTSSYMYGGGSVAANAAGYPAADLFGSPFDISGAHFSGLSYSTTLTINVRWIFERFPGPNEPDLVVLAQPPTPFDPFALELYTRALDNAPPGVMLSENPLGEWFTSVLRKVGEWAPKIGGALGDIGVPFANTVGKIAGAAAAKAVKAREKKEQKTMAPSEVVVLNPAKARQIKKRYSTIQLKRKLKGSASTTK